jgi:radical SAM superfamily enzyme with C-terminal helix-hairpin-helix motif
MGIESFDPAVIERNSLTCTPTILERAVATINEVGATTQVDGLPQLLPGLNLIYGLPGETHRTHHLNLAGLLSLYDAGYSCHRTNVRQLRVFPGTELADRADDTPRHDRFETWKDDITQLYEIPMKRRVYPVGVTLVGQSAFFVTQTGTWFRRLGSYPIQIIERNTTLSLNTPADLKVSDHAGRYIYGERVA